VFSKLVSILFPLAQKYDGIFQNFGKVVEDLIRVLFPCPAAGTIRITKLKVLGLASHHFIEKTTCGVCVGVGLNNRASLNPLGFGPQTAGFQRFNDVALGTTGMTVHQQFPIYIPQA
jgi:hypothetical protein